MGMNSVTFFIARRYLFSPKSLGAINLVSLVSAVGVVLGSFALTVVLSAYNGIEDFVSQLYGMLTPTLKVAPVVGKTFDPQTLDSSRISNVEGVAFYSEALVENALLQYADKQYITILYGVDRNFIAQSKLGDIIVDGEPTLQRGDIPCAIVGKFIAQTLDLHPQMIDLLWVSVPQRGRQADMLDVENALKRAYLRPAGIFSADMESDSKYVFVPLSFMQRLLNYNREVSSIALYLHPHADESKVQRAVQQIVGDGFTVKNRSQQDETIYRMMQSEKLAIFVILAFVLLIASFNSVGSLSMLIIEKRKDIATLRALGITQRGAARIFITEGMMISLLGCTVGVALGLLTCLLQIRFKLVKLTGNFLLDAYPVSVEWSDMLLIFSTVCIIGYVAAQLPVMYLLRKKL
jgi:lipoprotein-releasing system permease protein